MVLFSAIHGEYVNEDQVAKKEVIKRQFAHVATASNEYVRPSQLDQNMMYNFDKLFEDFRSSVEGVLSSDFEDSLTLTKSYEIIKKYNYIASYLKNIVKLTSLNERDEEKIETKFKELVPNLQNLYNVAVSKNFIDVGEIKAMLDNVQNQMFHTVASNVPNNIDSRVKNRNQTLKQVQEAAQELGRLRELQTKNPFLKRDRRFMKELQQLEEFFVGSNVEEIKKTLKHTGDIDSDDNKQYIQNIKGNVDKVNQLTMNPKLFPVFTSEEKGKQEKIEERRLQKEATREEKKLQKEATRSLKEEATRALKEEKKLQQTVLEQAQQQKKNSVRKKTK
jgi:hypothetical protein